MLHLPFDHRSLICAVLATVSAFACLSAITWTCSHFLHGFAGLVLATSMGAAAVLMFAAPDSPLATHWAFIGGNLVSAVIGVTIFQWTGNAFWSGGLAVAVSIFVMHLLRCQHPPGGATALMAVLGGSSVHQLGYLYVLAPIGINVLIFEMFVLAHRRFMKNQSRRERGVRS